MGDYLYIYAFNRIFTSLWTHPYVFYTTAYNLVLCYLLGSNCSSFGHWELFQLAPVSLWDKSIIVCVCVYVGMLNTSLLFGTIICSRLISCILYPSPRVSYFSKDFWSFLLKTGIRNQDLDSGYTCCSGGIFALRPSQFQSKGIYQPVFRNIAHTHPWVPTSFTHFYFP